MGRGAGSSSHEAVTREQLRRAAPGAKPAWAGGDQTSDPRWHAARQAKRLLVPPAEGQKVSVDASVLAGVVAELRAEHPELAADPATLEAWQRLLKRTDRQTVTVHRVAARSAKFADGRNTQALTPRDDVYVLAPEYAGERPIRLRALHLALTRMEGLPLELGELPE